MLLIVADECSRISLTRSFQPKLKRGLKMSMARKSRSSLEPSTISTDWLHTLKTRQILQHPCCPYYRHVDITGMSIGVE